MYFSFVIENDEDDSPDI